MGRSKHRASMPLFNAEKSAAGSGVTDGVDEWKLLRAGISGSVAVGL